MYKSLLKAILLNFVVLLFSYGTPEQTEKQLAQNSNTLIIQQENIISPKRENRDIIINLCSDNFTDNIKSGTVVVDFYSDRCPACVKFAPIFEQSAKTMQEKDIQFAKVNLKSSKSIGRKYRLSYMPTVILFQDGKEVKRHVGFLDADNFSKFIRTAN